VLNFTSALYLGQHHPSSSLRRWSHLSTGAPAALGEPLETGAIARALADLLGAEAAVLGASTFHLAWDVFGLLAENPITIFMDAGAYPITRWGVQRAAMRGAVVRTFRHQDMSALGEAFADGPRGRTPVIVTDGCCPGCGRVAPLAEQLLMARRHRGMLVVDDTQALGLLGRQPDGTMPYGRGGGGSLRWSGATGPEVIVLGSLAKSFGAPLAVLAGSRAFVRRFEERSLTRVHCSPPSTAALRAAEHALLGNRGEGESRRRRLLDLVRRFRRGLRAAGLAVSGGVFPVQSIRPGTGMPAPLLHRRLAERGLRAVLHQGEDNQPRVSFFITSGHTRAEIDAAVSCIAGAAIPPNIRWPAFPAGRATRLTGKSRRSLARQGESL
jgi:8-amino-7-oxononanoate synthase